MFARLREEAVPRTEDARVPQESVLRTESPFRTGNACFLHRMPLKMRRVPQEAFLNTECSFRTVEACFGTARFRKRIALGCPEHRQAATAAELRT